MSKKGSNEEKGDMIDLRKRDKGHEDSLLTQQQQHKKQRRQKKQGTNKLPNEVNSNGKPLKIVYGNMQGKSRKLWNEVEEAVIKEKADIVCLTETHWNEA